MDERAPAGSGGRSATNPVLACNHLTVAHDGVQVLFDVSLEVNEGEMVALLGANGVGKTTLLSTLSGEHTPTSGAIRLDGRDITTSTSDERVRLGLTHVVGQAAYGSLTVRENLRMYGYAGGRSHSELNTDIAAVLAVFPRLAARHDQMASTLSGGERQMLALARALVHEPRILLIDELSLGLAPIVVEALVELLRRLHTRGMSILLVEQAANVALELADRVYFLQHGRIVATGPAARFAGDPARVQSLLMGGGEPEDVEALQGRRRSGGQP